MGGLFGFVVGGMADRLVPILQTPVEDIVYDVIDNKELPTRAGVRELQNRIDRLEGTVQELLAALHSLQSEVARPRGVPAEVRQDAPEVAEASAPVPPAQALSTSTRGCRVPGCGEAVRAKGFCGKHYQKFKRSTLDGFVGVDGIVVQDGVRFRVGEHRAAEAVQVRVEGSEVVFVLDSGVVRVPLASARLD